MEHAAVTIRVVRAAVFTALCISLSAGAHVLLSANPLPLGMLAALSAGVFVVAYLLAGRRERGYWSIAALLVPLELAADTVFTTGQHTCYGQSGGPVAGSMRSLGLDLLCSGEFGTPLARMTARGEALAGTAASPWLLLAAHVGVGLVAAAWLRRGEAALAGLLRAAAAIAFRPLLLAVAIVTVAPVRSTGRPGRRSDRTRAVRPQPHLLHSVLRRGPPCPAAA
ncbi:hypothetical protein OG946_07745 [Streptomyces sp. NBC_01808]|uniref:hypothetical protein n=1 Tax=Streptomyces sp. NBC_01808 TaxID=2975947 RepID=UPI002DD988B7|nr:hypothetical protein [Streptomyces sp. NBC_01808]WSA37273.1 hypothetical protein OG946_07745 [Streptomyces sp. NBC_01808]